MNMIEIPIEDTNLALIGSREDKSAKTAAAALEVNWKDAGRAEGIEIWRIENKRDEKDRPVFGIQKWPIERYGEFYRGDSYIVLQTFMDDGGALQWNVFFWIGSQSSQDEYGVAAYKTAELDAYFGDSAIQYREVEKFECPEFRACFPHGIYYLEGGIDGGFRHVHSNESIRAPSRLYHCRKISKNIHCFQVPLDCNSLNQGDAFVLDAVNTVYTWYGNTCSPHERFAAAEMAQKLCSSRALMSKLVTDVKNDHNFWDLLGGKGPIKEAQDFQDDQIPSTHEPQMYVLSDKNVVLNLIEVPVSKTNLVSDDVCIIDSGTVVYVWIGKGSNKREHNQSMIIVQAHLKNMKRAHNTKVIRILEGQEKRIPSFAEIFSSA